MSDLGEQLQLHTAGHNLKLREQQREQNMWNPEKVKVSSDENPREVTQKKDTFVFPLNIYRAPPRSVLGIALSSGDTETSEPSPRCSEPWREALMAVGPQIQVYSGSMGAAREENANAGLH